MKPIEPGCLVLVIPHACSVKRNKHAGEVLTVVGKSDPPCIGCGRPHWRLSDRMRACESGLIRIDGDPEEVPEEESCSTT